ncbi:myb/SANT-like DNA-binding domain-containing protein 4 [Maniola hyperantus]|uniref:myb/SANT-like DNA-binding domain-containing protein 4 n=1 Tax=Aphantopus hyperantus TaxID=2795564 RepID=UPI0037490468
MADKRKRSQNFTFDEKDRLVKLLDVFKDIILNKKTDGTTNQAKNEAWVNLCTQFNSTGSTARSKESLMRVWEKMKTDAKLYKSRSRSSYTGTGGGPSSFNADPILEQVSDLMGRGCTGIAGVQDSDADQQSSSNPIQSESSSLPILGDEMMEVLIYQDENCSTSNMENIEIKEGSVGNHDVDEIATTPSLSQVLKSTPVWKRRRPVLKENNDKAEALYTLCGGFKELNSRKAIAEDLKIKILEEELQFKRDLYQLQLETARRELEIKTEICDQLKRHTYNVGNIFGMPANGPENT